MEGVWTVPMGCLNGLWCVYMYLKGKSGLVNSTQVKLGQIKSGQVMSGQVKSGQVKSGQVK